MGNRKADKKKRFYTALQVILFLAAAFSAFQIYLQLKDYHDSNELYSRMEEEYVLVFEDDSQDSEDLASVDGSEEENPASVKENGDEPAMPFVEIDFASLKEQNPDIVGWLYFENEDISYPILYSGDNSTYLHISFDGKSAYAGSIFEDGSCSPDFDDAHTILYGHNMRNLSMFGKLKYYYRDEDYYQDHQYFQIVTEDMARRYRIFAYEIVDADSDIYTIGFDHDAEFADYIQQIRKLSMIHPDIDLDEENQVVTLSTCTSGNNRFVVHGVLVEFGIP